MSATHGTSALAIAILIAWTGPGATQETGTALDVANIPAAAGAYATPQPAPELKGPPTSWPLMSNSAEPELPPA